VIVDGVLLLDDWNSIGRRPDYFTFPCDGGTYVRLT
jgi:hypothetical protein